MRINVYHHELLKMAERGAEHVRKTADTGVVFHGVRFYTEAPLMHQPGDDDSSAITLWVPWTKKRGHDSRSLIVVAEQIINFSRSIPT